MDTSNRIGSLQLEAHVEKAKRPSVMFEPSVWGDYFIGAGPLPCEQNVSTKERRNNLIKGVGYIIELCSADKDLLNGMKTIDAVERLGIGYHFEREIDKFMDILNNTGHEEILNNIPDKEANFTVVAMRFRLLRQHRFDVPCDIFDDFMNEKGELAEKLCHNVDALVSLYEAAFLGKPDEKFLESVVEIARGYLSNLLIGGHLSETILMKVQYALAIPSYRRMKRLDAKLYIPIYEKEDACKDEILELAKLDFHALLLMHREELKHITSWDEEAANRVGGNFGYIMALLSKTLLEFVADGASVLGVDCTKHIIKKVSECMLQEVVWREEGMVPSLNDHLSVTTITTCYWALACISFVGMSKDEESNKLIFDWVREFPTIIVNSCAICRLMDDISGHEREKDGNNVATAVACYARDHGTTEEDAKEALRCMVEDQWRSINKEFLSNKSIPTSILTRVINLARVMENMYREHDAYTQSSKIKDSMEKVLNECILH